MTWGRPVTEPGAGWAVIDVETSGFRPSNARVISLAVLALDACPAAVGEVVAERAIGTGGPIREYYLVSSADTDDLARHRTEVCWPVFRTGAA